MSVETPLSPPDPAAGSSAFSCPRCGTRLRSEARECTRCDWVAPEKETRQRPDGRAALLSTVPGFGHAYKGHYLHAVVIFITGNLVILPLAVVTAPGTLGLSLLLIPGYVAGLMVHAYHAPDLRAGEREGKPARRYDPFAA